MYYQPYPVGVGTRALRRHGTHECSSAQRSGNENAGLSGRGEKLGTARSVHAATKGSAFSGSIDRALGQSRQSPIFRRLCCFRRWVRYKRRALFFLLSAHAGFGFGVHFLFAF
jgi:hypothetical protein